MDRDEWLIILCRGLGVEPSHIWHIRQLEEDAGRLPPPRGKDGKRRCNGRDRVTIIEAVLAARIYGRADPSPGQVGFTICAIEWGEDGVTAEARFGVSVRAHISRAFLGSIGMKMSDFPVGKRSWYRPHHQGA